MTSGFGCGMIRPVSVCAGLRRRSMIRTGHTDEYLRILNEIDKQEEADEIPEELTRKDREAKLERAKNLLGFHKRIELME